MIFEIISLAHKSNLKVSSLLDLLDTENEVLTSHRAHINGVFDRQYACYRLLASMGVLLETVAVKPREESIVGSGAD